MRHGHRLTPPAISLFQLLQPEYLLAGTQELYDLEHLTEVVTPAMAGEPARSPSEYLAILQSQVGTLTNLQAHPNWGFWPRASDLKKEVEVLRERLVRVHCALSRIKAFTTAMEKVQRRLTTCRWRFTQAWKAKAEEALSRTSVAHVFREEILLDLASDIYASCASGQEGVVMAAIETSAALTRSLETALLGIQHQHIDALDRCMGFSVESPSLRTASPSRTSNSFYSTLPLIVPVKGPEYPYLHITLTGQFDA